MCPEGDAVRTAIGVVEGGHIRLPSHIRLSEGQRVLVEWQEEPAESGVPLEREPLTREDIQQDIEWARTWRQDR
jgi:hypothetical protein